MIVHPRYPLVAFDTSLLFLPFWLFYPCFGLFCFPLFPFTHRSSAPSRSCFRRVALQPTSCAISASRLSLSHLAWAVLSVTQVHATASCATLVSVAIPSQTSEEAFVGLEPKYQDIGRSLSGLNMEEEDADKRRSSRRQAKNFAAWNGHSFVEPGTA